MVKALLGKVCLVTGGTRGMGRGIALQLADAGATVYITGRTLKRKEGQVVGSLEDTAAEIKSRNGLCVPVVVDHTKDEQVKALFERIRKEQNGQLDILVNNAYSAVNALVDSIGVPFWEQDIGNWDLINNVGLRNHFMCTVHASHMMVPRKQGLIVNISSIGGLRYLLNAPYGVGKQALDRMSVDCAIELRPYNIAMVSLWPSFVQTEVIQEKLLTDDFKSNYYQPGIGAMTANKIQGAFKNKGRETAEFSGRAIVHLAQDPAIMKKSGRILLSGDLAKEYGFTDIDGRSVASQRSLKIMLETLGWTTTAKFVPIWVNLPYFAMTLTGSKF